jgi:tetratricopeptide (TPR) repeat protein
VKKVFYAILLLSLYLSVIFPFTAYLKNKPYVEKLGYVPKGEVLRYIVADQKELVAASLVMRSLFYFGGLVDSSFNKLDLPVDYPAMSRVVHAAVKLDPYNMDAYYFAQATLVWDAKQVKLANDLLDYGMQYRTWDVYLPLFAGFNSSYFLKDYKKAAHYYKMAADLSGAALYINLAGRYLYESGQSEMAIAYLTSMEQGARNEAIKKAFQVRLQALKEGRRIELARDRYRQNTGHLPASVKELLHAGYLAEPPVDPYGGTYYLEPDGSVRSTSKFAFGARGTGEKQ